jgi:hypothetical protein
MEDKTLAIIAGVAVLAVLLFSMFGLQLFSIGGGTVLSLSQVQYTNDLSGWGQVWIANVIGNGADQQLIAGNTERDYVTAPDGTKSNLPLLVGVTLQKQSCDYPISTQYTTMNKIEVIGKPVTLDFPTCPNYNNLNFPNGLTCNAVDLICISQYDSKCAANGGRSVTCPIAGQNIGRECVQFTPVDSIQAFDLSSKTTKIGYLVQMTNSTANDNPPIESLKVGNAEGYQQTAISADGLVRAIASNLVDSLSQSCPSETAGKLMRHNYQDTAIKATLWNTYRADIPTLVNTASIDAVYALRDAHNAKYQTLLNNANQYPFGETFPTKINTGVVSIDRISNPSAFGQLQLIMKVGYLGVYEPISNPQVLTISPDPLYIQSYGELKTANINIINNGATGGVYLTVSCPAGVSVTSPAQLATINSGGSKVFTTAITGVEGTYTCTATAKDATSTHISTKNFQVVVSPICTISCSAPRIIRPPCSCECPSVCPSGQSQQADCSCRCPNTCQVYESQWTDCSCHVGSTPTPTATTTPTATPTPPPCATGTYWCPSSASCIPNSTTCGIGGEGVDWVRVMLYGGAIILAAGAALYFGKGGKIGGRRR